MRPPLMLPVYFLGVAALALVPTEALANDTHKWITGTVTDISVVDRQRPEGSYDYTIESGNRRFVIRSESSRPSGSNSRSGGSSVGGQESAGIPVNVGEVITFAPEGGRAWILVSGKEYLCSVLRQTLLSPQTRSQTSEAKPDTPRSSTPVKTAIEQPPPPALSPVGPAPYGKSVARSGTPSNPQGSSSGSSSALDGGGVTAPALLYKLEPACSEEALNAGIQGRVILFVEIDPTGSAVNPKVVRSLGLGLDEKAIEAVRKWKFRPGYKDGKPFTVAANIQVNFRCPVPLRKPAEDAPVAAGGPWIRMRSVNFEIYTDATGQRARLILEYFERAYSVFAGLTGYRIGGNSRVNIVAFASQAEYEPYQVKPFAAAYYDPRPDGDYIVLGDASSAFPAMLHEYAHLMARHANLNLPPWLNEGLADVYSTLRPEANGVLVGTPPPGRLEALLRNPWVPLTAIISADLKSPYYNDRDKAQSLYGEGWALTHMLKFSGTYGPGYTELLKLINSGMPSDQALELVYRRQIGAIESALQAYIHQPLPTVVVPINVGPAEALFDMPREMKASETKHILNRLPKAKWRKTEQQSAQVHQVSERPGVAPVR